LAAMSEEILGVIGGTGLSDIEGLEGTEQKELETPFGRPSGAYLCGTLHGTRVAFLPRHGAGHVLMPSEVNYRANIHGFRQLGVRYVLSISAVGSLKEDIRPGDMVLPAQFIDRTRGRAGTFFGRGAVAHVQFGDPVCPRMVAAVAAVLREGGVRFHTGCTYVAMEGPVFSSRAESELYRGWGAHVIGMTSIPEAKLAREAEICYATLALSTDYDCWHQTEEEVSVDAVIQLIAKNISVAKQTIAGLCRRFPPPGACKCQKALEGALLTPVDLIPEETRRRLEVLAGRFFN
jgi:5'-methylthioadenosine phosphorylase